ncbi:MAG: hypothetical protein UR26_C0001G0032 [candidate division TM6 bacterium GW2011_GWF2_32_72]|nr:MAG: hypothetical protein UR26_C0001G0032 [candidate division TM6 bacterium GW2011_GWF2_32_72]
MLKKLFFSVLFGLNFMSYCGINICVSHSEFSELEKKYSKCLNSDFVKIRRGETLTGEIHYVISLPSLDKDEELLFGDFAELQNSDYQNLLMEYYFQVIFRILEKKLNPCIVKFCDFLTIRWNFLDVADCDSFMESFYAVAVDFREIFNILEALGRFDLKNDLLNLKGEFHYAGNLCLHLKKDLEELQQIKLRINDKRYDFLIAKLKEDMKKKLVDLNKSTNCIIALINN